MATQQTQAPVVQPGQTFDIPGVVNATQFYDTYDSTDGLAFTPNSSVQSVVNNIGDFERTDIVFDWLHEVNLSSITYTADGATFTTSPYFPYSAIQNVQLKLQNQYFPINCSGIDWYILNLVRPYRRTAAKLGTNVGANPAGSSAENPGEGYLYKSTPQGNYVVPNQFTAYNTEAAFTLFLDVPAGIWLDEYYALDPSGNYLDAAPDMFVSPAYMSNVGKTVKTKLTIAPLIASTVDNAMVGFSGGTPSASAAGSLTIRRQGVYANSSTNSLPAPQPWQYAYSSEQYSLSGVSKSSLVIPDNLGQILSMTIRLFDPAANSGVGGPLDWDSNVQTVQLQYGSGLSRFYGTPAELQQRWIATNGALLPQGCGGVDLAQDEFGTISNKRCLNTYSDAGLVWNFVFNSTLSTAAYAVVNYEYLTYVS